jgi:hypothetical protein
MRALVLLLGLLLSGDALAYGFMVRHHYTTCSSCHVDPSGGSLVSPYGRAQGELLLRSRYGVPADEPGPEGEFLFGLVKLPEPFLASGDVRLAFTSGRDFSAPRVFPMQADLTAGIQSGQLVVSASVGVGSAAAASATLFGDTVRAISRHHWVGYAPDEDRQWLVRFGRMNLPFGLRLPEHPAWVRQVTGTDTAQGQQHGLAVAYSGERLRAEVMGIVGNLQLNPPDFRERGYAATAEVALTPAVLLGASSRLTHAERDFAEPTRAVFRHAHGLSARLVPIKPLVVSLEADFVWETRRGLGGPLGVVALAHLDLEPVQGFHLVGVAEVKAREREQAAVGGWIGAWWFLAPHVNVRVDLITRAEAQLHTSLLAQVHLFL